MSLRGHRTYVIPSTSPYIIKLTTCFATRCPYLARSRTELLAFPRCVLCPICPLRSCVCVSVSYKLVVYQNIFSRFSPVGLNLKLIAMWPLQYVADITADHANLPSAIWQSTAARPVIGIGHAVSVFFCEICIVGRRPIIVVFQTSLCLTLWNAHLLSRTIPVSTHARILFRQ